MNDEGLADAANPFRLPRLHPGIGQRATTQHAGQLLVALRITAERRELPAVPGNPHSGGPRHRVKARRLLDSRQPSSVEVPMRLIGLVVLAASLALAPLAAETQPATKVPRLGFLGAVPRSAPGIRAFEERLRELGYVDGRSIAIEFRTAAGNLDLLPSLAAELVRLDIDLLVAGGSE